MMNTLLLKIESYIMYMLGEDCPPPFYVYVMAEWIYYGFPDMACYVRDNWRLHSAREYEIE
jgi:hypothetical protein